MPIGDLETPLRPLTVQTLRGALLVLAVDVRFQKQCHLRAAGSWRNLECPQPDSIWASSPEDVWAVSEDPTSRWGCRAHYDGSSWTQECLDNLEGRVIGFAADDVWIGARWHFDGEKWTEHQEVSTHGGPEMLALGGTSGRDFWRAESHFDGERWTPTPRRDPWTPIAVAGGASSETLWAVQGDGTVLTRTPSGWEPTGSTVGAIDPYRGHTVGTSASDLWYIAGTAQHFDGTTWSARPGPFQQIAGFFFEAGVLTVTDGVGFWSWRDDEWSPRRLPGGPIGTGAATGTELWMWTADADALVRWTGTAWQEVIPAVALRTNVVPTAIGDEIWVTATEYDEGPVTDQSWSIWRWNGAALTEMRRGAHLVGGTSKADVWAAAVSYPYGRPAPLWKFDGTRWSAFPPLPMNARSWVSINGEALYAFSQGGAVFSHRAP